MQRDHEAAAIAQMAVYWHPAFREQQLGECKTVGNKGNAAQSQSEQHAKETPLARSVIA